MTVYKVFYAHVWESHYLYTDSLGIRRWSQWSMYCLISAWENSTAYKNGAVLQK